MNTDQESNNKNSISSVPNIPNIPSVLSVPSIPNIQCSICNAKFKYPSGLSRHRNRCQILKKIKDDHDKEITTLKIETQNEIKNIENKCKIEKLEERVVILQDQLKKSEEQHKFYEKIIKESNVMAKTTMGALAYAMMNLTTAPRIQPINNIEQFILDGRKKDNFEQFILYLFRNNMLETHIAGMLVKAYKTPNPEDQTFWNTDAARLSYILRAAVGDETEWQTDKGGVKLRNMVIEPMLENIKLRMIDYMTKCNKLLIDTDNKEKMEILKEMELIHELIDLINSKVIAKNIIRFIAPEFYLNIRSKAITSNQLKEPEPDSENEKELIISSHSDSEETDSKSSKASKASKASKPKEKKKKGRPKKVEKKK